MENITTNLQTEEERKYAKKSGGAARNRARRTAVDLAECAIFATLMVAAAYIKIPFPFVPLTFQTAVSILTGLMLGAKKGAAAIGAYAFAGLIGLPVFASGGGFSYVVNPSFGYIIGFIAAAFVAGIISGGKIAHSAARYFIAAFAALAVNYAVGIVYFIGVWLINGYEGLWNAVAVYNLLYLPKDALLSALAAIAAKFALPAVKRMRGKGGLKE